MQAKDVMTPDVITVSPETYLTSVARILLNHRISAAFVVDEHGHVVGVVSDGDLMRRSDRDPGRSWWLSLVADPKIKFLRREGVHAKDVMTQDVISISQDASLSEVALILESNHVKRVAVIESGRLVGVVSRTDVLHGLASLSVQAVGPTVEDWDIRAGIFELVKRRGGVSMQSVNVVVVDREVHLWGIVDDDEDKAAVRIAAESLVGASNVHTFLNTLAEVARGAS
jgi:CBS domain-containing protein